MTRLIIDKVKYPAWMTRLIIDQNYCVRGVSLENLKKKKIDKINQSDKFSKSDFILRNQSDKFWRSKLHYGNENEFHLTNQTIKFLGIKLSLKKSKNHKKYSQLLLLRISFCLGQGPDLVSVIAGYEFKY